MNFLNHLNIRSVCFSVLLIFGISFFGFTQRVTTAAGGSGDGGQALSADLFGTTTVAVDGSGNVFIADIGTRTIRRVDKQTGIISRVAGNGSTGAAGDGGLAINAQLGDPSGVALDASGNIYVADQLYNVIRKITKATGLITRVGGTGNGTGFTGDNGLAVEAKIWGPHALTVDGSGNIFFTDTGNQRIRKINAATGIITTIAGNGSNGYSGDDGPATSAGLSNPNNVAVDANGNVYIADYTNNRIRKVNAASGIITTVAGKGTIGYSGDGGLAIQAELNNPCGVLVDAEGNLIISDTYNARIRKVNLATGIINTIAGTGTAGFLDGSALLAKLSVPQGLAMDVEGNIYFNEYTNRRIRKLSGGTVSTVAGNGGFDGDGALATDASLHSPEGVAVDADGNIYISDRLNSRIRKVDHTSGNISTLAGDGTSSYNGEGGLASNALLNAPKGMVIDKNGNLVFVDSGNGRVRMIDKTTGIITSLAGIGGSGSAGDNGLATGASLNFPAGVAFDTQGNLYIADQYNHKIRKVTASTGIITTVAGDGTMGFAGDNGPAVNAKLNNPLKIALDANNNLFIVDTNNNRIRKVNLLTGIITTVASSPPNEQPMLVTDVMAQGSDLYILESNRMLKLDLTTGASTIIAGTTATTTGYLGDGGSALEAQFKYMSSFHRDQTGNFFIADTENNRIRKISTRAPQTITFDALPSKTYGDASFDLIASSSSGLAVSFNSSNVNVASVNGKTVTIVGAGTTTLTAIQPGDLDYSPSSLISQPVLVNKATQTISFGTIATKTIGDPNFNLEAAATSGLEIAYSTSTDKIAIAGKQVTLVKAGRVTVKAEQTGNTNYMAASAVERSFCINPAKPVITMTPGTSGITLTSSNDAGNQWLLNGELVAGATAKTFSPDKVGTYTVRSMADDCTSELSNGYDVIITGIEEVKPFTSITVYPNPAEKFLIVQMRSSQSTLVEFGLQDLFGRSVLIRAGTTNEELTLDIRDLSSGVYFIRATSGTRQQIERFVKK